MCGIIVVCGFHQSPDTQRFAKALDALEHRGPDGSGSTVHPMANGGAIALGHQRLSIFDLSDAGAQPMADKKRHCITYNGEIFNWPELRAELEQHGYVFHTQTDTEVILAAYDRWGPDCVKRFNGFWAFGILDESDEERGPVLFFSRDRSGIKPLYYWRDGDESVWASEIAAIFQYRAVAPKVDMRQLARELIYHRRDDSEATIYLDIKELEPAHNAILNVRTGEISVTKYWAPKRERITGSDSEILEKFTEIFEDAVRIRLRSDREVALTLSGGVDSSAIAVAISRVHGGKVRAFTSHFPTDGEIDETHYAKIVAEKCGMRHVLVQPEILDLVAEERMLTRRQELPYDGLSMLVNWAVIKEIKRQGIVVFLTGQGGDELFLGYERYLVPYLRHVLLTSPHKFADAVSRSMRNSRISAKRLATFVSYYSGRQFRKWRSRWQGNLVFSPRMMRAIPAESSVLPMSLFELQTREVCGAQLRHLLRQDDHTEAAFGTEGRPAFLDHRLIEFGMSLDWRFKVRDGWTKYLLRLYLDKAGLPEIAWRQYKLGYNAPADKWFKQLTAANKDLVRSDVAHALLRHDLEFRDVPNEMVDTIYNVLSLAREFEWSL